MIDKYLVEHAGAVIGVKYDKKTKKLIVGGKQKKRLTILFFITNILNFKPEDIKDVTFRQYSLLRYTFKIKPLDFYNIIDGLMTDSSFDITVRQVAKIDPTVM